MKWGGFLKVSIVCLSLAILLVPSMSKAEEKEEKVVYHCDFGDDSRFNDMLTNIYNLVDYYTTHNVSYDVRVVANGACVQFLLKDRKGTKFESKKIEEKQAKHTDEMMKSLVDGYGVKFEQCNITLNRMKIEKTKLEPFVSIIPSGQVRVVELHDKGFAYIKVQ